MDFLITPLAYLCSAYFNTPQHLLATTVGATAGMFTSEVTTKAFKSLASTVLGKKEEGARLSEEEKTSQKLIKNIIMIASNVLNFTALYYLQTTFIGLLGGQLTGIVPWATMTITSVGAGLVIYIALSAIKLGGNWLYVYFYSKMLART